MAWYFLNLAMDFLTVSWFVRVPPSQRSTQTGIPVALAASRMISLAWRLVPTKRMLPPLATVSSTNFAAFSRAAWVLARSMMEMPWRWSKTKGFERGFQRLV